MIESVLTKRNVSLRTKITVKSAIAVGLVALAVALPQVFHAAFGAAGGVTWLPMYLPVLIGGCLLGFKWGLGIGILSPIVSFLITLGIGDPMPAATRLPYMTVELAVFATVSGLFSKRIAQNSWMAFPAVLIAALSGRAVFLALAAIFQSVSPLSAAVVWAQIEAGFIGLMAQIVLVPVIVMLLSSALDREKKTDK